jgi:class 3 adenylate cyclase
MIPSIGELQQFVADRLHVAINAATRIDFSILEGSEKYGRTKSLADKPRFAPLAAGYGSQAWAAVLFVDLRRSTRRAVEIGPKKTYLTVHALLPTLAHLVSCAAGDVANFRGDGLFALFGLDEEGNNPKNLDCGQEVKKAVRCGKAMLEAVDEVVNAILPQFDVPGDLNIGIGIDVGDVVITRVGLAGVNEVTAYGNAVNHAAKFCGGNGAIIVSERAWHLFPKGPNGRIAVKPVELSDGRRGLKVVYPKDMTVIPRPAKKRA